MKIIIDIEEKAPGMIVVACAAEGLVSLKEKKYADAILAAFDRECEVLGAQPEVQLFKDKSNEKQN